ncbi:hypothetical protein GA566_25675 [Cupriavidus sp. SW-Y-13]|nr:hypothetical protein [Cupriavidus sp. SW-Y-13]
MLFNGEQIMTAGEIRRPAIGPIHQFANHSFQADWAEVGHVHGKRRLACRARASARQSHSPSRS